MKDLTTLVERLDEIKRDKEMAVNKFQKEDVNRQIDEFFQYFNAINFVNINNEDDIEQLQTGLASVIFDESKFVDYLQENNIEYFTADEYVENGYDQKHEPFDIFFANWNQIEDKKMMDFIENNVDIEWSDEWSTCDCCHKAFRVQPDSWHWKPHYWINEDGYTCFECLSKDIHIHAYIQHYLNNKDDMMFFDGVDLEKHGFKLFNNENSYNERFISGFERSDKPEDILKRIDTDKYDFLFKHYSSSQFNVHYELYIKEK